MVSIQHSKRSDSKQCTVEVRWGIFIENLTIFFNPQSSCKYSQTNSYNFAMTLIFQDDHLTAGAWAACEWVCMTWPLIQYQFRQICLTVNSYISLFHPMFLFLYLFFPSFHFLLFFTFISFNLSLSYFPSFFIFSHLFLLLYILFSLFFFLFFYNFLYSCFSVFFIFSFTFVFPSLSFLFFFSFSLLLSIFFFSFSLFSFFFFFFSVSSSFLFCFICYIYNNII